MIDVGLRELIDTETMAVIDSMLRKSEDGVGVVDEKNDNSADEVEAQEGYPIPKRMS
jgi:hypothetical protein